MPVQVSRVATALRTRPSGSCPNASAISRHGRPKPAAVRGPIRPVNSPGSSEKRPSASIRHVKRNGCWRGSGEGSPSHDGASAGGGGAEGIGGGGAGGGGGGGANGDAR